MSFESDSSENEYDCSSLLPTCTIPSYCQLHINKGNNVSSLLATQLPFKPLLHVVSTLLVIFLKRIMSPLSMFPQKTTWTVSRSIQTNIVTMSSIIPLRGQTFTPWTLCNIKTTTCSKKETPAGTWVLLLCCGKQEGMEVKTDFIHLNIYMWCKLWQGIITVFIWSFNTAVITVYFGPEPVTVWSCLRMRL